MQQFTREYLDREYNQKKRSLDDIANENGTYPNKIRRALIKFGYIPRNRSTAQSVALSSGRHKHPTKGTERSEVVKEKIGREVSNQWNGLSQEERERRIDVSKQNWAAMTDEERDKLRKLAAEAVREASKIGSKTERFLYQKFRANNIYVELHKTILPYTKLCVDLFLPTYNIIIEIDGPSHFMDIWGEDELTKKQLADQEKNGLLLTKGFTVIRVKILQKNISNVYQIKVFDEIMKILNNKNRSNNIEDRLIRIEVK